MAHAVRALAAAFALLAPALAPAVELGTFFHTPEERQRIDRQRRGEPAPSVAKGEARPRGAAALTGYVQRSDGKNTVWIDGIAVPTTNPRAAPLFDPRKVRDDVRSLPALSEPPVPPAK